MPNTI